ncbi:hypothetical protein QJQ45_002078 [Haematococcus lacustris]|nr:hypothetical protein QJQ45_002078 [Haematococcus lacustris]
MQATRATDTDSPWFTRQNLGKTSVAEYIAEAIGTTSHALKRTSTTELVKSTLIQQLGGWKCLNSITSYVEHTLDDSADAAAGLHRAMGASASSIPAQPSVNHSISTVPPATAARLPPWRRAAMSTALPPRAPMVSPPQDTPVADVVLPSRPVIAAVQAAASPMTATPAPLATPASTNLQLAMLHPTSPTLRLVKLHPMAVTLWLAMLHPMAATPQLVKLHPMAVTLWLAMLHPMAATLRLVTLHHTAATPRLVTLLPMLATLRPAMLNPMAATPQPATLPMAATPWLVMLHPMAAIPQPAMLHPMAATPAAGHAPSFQASHIQGSHAPSYCSHPVAMSYGNHPAGCNAPPCGGHHVASYSPSYFSHPYGSHPAVSTPVGGFSNGTYPPSRHVQYSPALVMRPVSMRPLYPSPAPWPCVPQGVCPDAMARLSANEQLYVVCQQEGMLPFIVIGLAVIGLAGASVRQPQRKKRKPENATDGGSTDSMDGLHLLNWLACLTFGISNTKTQISLDDYIHWCDELVSQWCHLPFSRAGGYHFISMGTINDQNQFIRQAEEHHQAQQGPGHAKQLVVFFGAASIGTGGGWGADAVLRACCKVVCRPRGAGQRRGRVVLMDEHRTTRVSSAVNGQQPCEEELDHEQPTRRAGWKPPAGQVDLRLLRPAWSQQRGQPVRGLMWCPVVAPRKPPQAPRSSQAATQPAASEPGPSTPPPAKRSKRTKAEQAAEPTQPTKAAKAKPAPQPGRWLDRDCNAALNMQRIGESRWRPLELCWWPDQTALPAKGKEYPGLGYKRLRDKPHKAQEQQQPAVAQ